LQGASFSQHCCLGNLFDLIVFPVLDVQALSRVLSNDGFPLQILDLSWNNISPADARVLCDALSIGVGPLDDDDLAAAEVTAAAAAAAGARTAEVAAKEESSAREQAYRNAVADALSNFYSIHAPSDMDSDLPKVIRLVNESQKKRDQVLELLYQRYGERWVSQASNARVVLVLCTRGQL